MEGREVLGGPRAGGVLSFNGKANRLTFGLAKQKANMASRATERINFGRIKEVVAPPNLIEIQVDSYFEFLQLDAAPSRRKNLGLQAVFTEVFPIESYDGKIVLDFHKTKSIDSVSLETLLWAHDRLVEVEGSIRVCRLGEMARKIFEVVQFERLFEIHDDVTSAVNAFA